MAKVNAARRAYLAIIETPIAQAVEPERRNAIRSAVKASREYYTKLRNALAKGDYILDNVAPKPERNLIYKDHEKYKMMDETRSTFLRFFDFDVHIYDYTGNGRPRAGAYRNLLREAIDETNARYDAFVYKLVKKVGEHSEAALVGSHVWSHSILTVTTPTGVQRWKTKSKWNYSKYGLAYMQWPSLELKK